MSKRVKKVKALEGICDSKLFKILLRSVALNNSKDLEPQQIFI
ncbi:MAG TPA: hypothetical protein VE089_08100 [Nitrososphaeraceae archaeon]|nr:hypothetical protein [Nitrososphaeraceae archaeon]